MKNGLILVAGVVLLGGCATYPAETAEAPADASASTEVAAAADIGPFAAGAGAAETNEACTVCHGADQVINASYDAEGWADTVDRMMSYGAEVSDEDFETIVNYLAANYGA